MHVQRRTVVTTVRVTELQWDQPITDHKVNTIFSETVRQFFL
jgi:hypothetical protein